MSIGVGFAIFLLVVFFIGRALFDGGSSSTEDDLRVAITQILITAFSLTAYAYLLISTRKTTQDLGPIAQELPDWQNFTDRAGKHPWWVLPLVGLMNVLLIGISVTNATTPEPVNPWAWQTWNYDVMWHRLTTVFLVWWISCFCYVTVVESARLSRLSEKIKSLDLLDLRPYRPLIRQGLTNALLVIGVVSVLSLLGIESRYVPVLVGLWIMFILLAWIGMMLPLRGIRRKIKVAKDQELQWCTEQIRQSRDGLKSDTGGMGSMADVMAYRSMIESIRNWPFDSPTLIRFALYLLIPLGSWLGGAFVERALDYLLS